MLKETTKVYKVIAVKDTAIIIRKMEVAGCPKRCCQDDDGDSSIL